MVTRLFPPQVRILVPVDFSTHTERALEYAAALASRFDGSIELLHVADTSDAVTTASRQLSAMALRLATPRVPVRITVLLGEPASQIVERARAIDASLIVIGTHGRTGLAHILLGSVAEQVVRTSPCLVLTFRGTTDCLAEIASQAEAA
jgi:nucleotide-binding universal stress UspA family protein